MPKLSGQREAEKVIFDTGGYRDNNVWKWKNSEVPIKHFLWAPGEPNDQATSNIIIGVACIRNYLWYDDTPDGFTGSYICQMKQCPEGFILYDDHCYSVPDDRLLYWPEAISACHSKGGKLVEFDTPGKIDSVKNFLQGYYNGGFFLWTGGWNSGQG